MRKANTTRKRRKLPYPQDSVKLGKKVYIVDDYKTMQDVYNAMLNGEIEEATIYSDAEVSLLKKHTAEIVRAIDVIKTVFPLSIVIDIKKKGSRW